MLVCYPFREGDNKDDWADVSSVGVGRGGRFTKAQEGEGGGIGLAMLTDIFWIWICICKASSKEPHKVFERLYDQLWVVIEGESCLYRRIVSL